MYSNHAEKRDKNETKHKQRDTKKLYCFDNHICIGSMNTK